MKTISGHVLDIVQNSVRAKATLIEIIVDEDKINDLYALTVKDNGCGMSKEVLKQAADPFFTSRNTRKVGLGLALLKQNAEAANGFFNLVSEEGKGTEVHAAFQLLHLDRPPMGDIWNTWFLTLLGNPEIRLVYRHQTQNGSFTADSDEIKKMLGEVPLQQGEMKAAVIQWFINNLEEIEASK